ncbi:MAG: hypothetical protein IH986_01905 [Planctomycetes bacterium]|nr:hypothetical protein [Planctomycetota bacterium]
MADVTIERIEFNEKAVADQAAEQGGERLRVIVMTDYESDTGDTVFDTGIDGKPGTAKRFAKLVSDFVESVASDAAAQPTG